MPCWHCGYAYSKIIYGAAKPEGYRRRRLCLSPACGKGFITFERAAKDKETIK